MNEDQFRKLAEEASCDIRTVYRAYAGATLKPLCQKRLNAAAERLGLEPPKPQNKSESRGA